MATVVSRGIHILNILGLPVMRIPPKQVVDLIEEIRLTVAGAVAGTSVDLAKLGADVVAMGANRILPGLRRQTYGIQDGSGGQQHSLAGGRRNPRDPAAGVQPAGRQLDRLRQYL